MEIEINIPAIQGKVTQCIKADCPVADSCLRQIVRNGCTKDLSIISIVNPDAIEMTDNGCQFFKSTEGKPFGVGFGNYILSLTVIQAKTARAVLADFFNSRQQYYRYHNGSLKISMEKKEEMESVLAANGLPTPLTFDDIIYEYE